MSYKNHDYGDKPVNVLADDPNNTLPEHVGKESEPEINNTAESASESAQSGAEQTPTGAIEEDRTEPEKKEKQRVIVSAEYEEEKPDLIIELSKIYDYDGDEIEKIDLTGLDNISEAQQNKANKIYRRIAENVSVSPELTTDFAVAITHVLTEIPLEVIRQFSFRDKIRLKNAVMAFLYNDN